MEQENKPNLIKKLISKFKSAKIVKKLASITLALGLAISVTACTNTQNQNNNNTNTGNGTNIENPNSPNENPYAQYSELLQYVLTNDYYNNLLDQAKVNSKLYDTPKFNAHPYGFLEDEGYDINAIKNGNLACLTMGYYVLDDEPNNLYIATNVETKASTPYYTEYLLKYNLTDKEMEDFHKMHTGFYIQACFLNDAISRLKTPTIICKTRCSVEAHHQLASELNKLSAIKEILKDATLGDITLKSFDETNGTFEVYVRTAKSGTMSMVNKSAVIATVPLTALDLLEISNNVFIKPSKWGNFTYDFNKIDLNSGKDATLYAVGNILHNQTIDLTT